MHEDFGIWKEYFGGGVSTQLRWRKGKGASKSSRITAQHSLDQGEYILWMNTFWRKIWKQELSERISFTKGKIMLLLIWVWNETEME